MNLFSNKIAHNENIDHFNLITRTNFEFSDKYILYTINTIDDLRKRKFRSKTKKTGNLGVFVSKFDSVFSEI